MGLLARVTDYPAAVTIGDQIASHDDIFGAATSVAERVAGIERVAVLATPELRTVIAIVGALIAGVTVVPIPPDSGPAELDHLLDDSGARAWLGAAADGSDLPVIPVRMHARSWHSYAEPPADHIAMILYTSGTTGKPKGVMLSRHAIAAGLDALFDAWQWTSRDVLVHGLPLFHVHGLILGILGPLRLGGRVVHTVKPTPENYAAAQGSIYFGVPTVWTRIADAPEAAAALRPARLLISGSAPLPAPLFERLTELTGHQPVERYGMSETLITVATRADGPRIPGAVGTPVVGVDTRLRDEAGAEVPHDGESVGSLQVRGAQLYDGYLNNPDATAASTTEDGWFITGDVATIDANGVHRIVGRQSTDLIKSGGYRIGAGEIETVLLGHPAVKEVAVVGLPDPDLGQRIVAYVVGQAPEKELIDHVAEQLSTHKRPREIRFVESLPRNAMGKVQKKLLG